MSTGERIRAWSGPVILSYGFRPFFLGGSLWAALSVAIWILTLTGAVSLPTAFDAVSWHAHEFLFGYLGAVAAGFLLTAVPNWTGRLPIVGWRLGGLAALWVAGRTAIAVSEAAPAHVVAVIDLAFPVALGAAIAREIIAGRNLRNLVVLAMLTVFVIGNAVFHWEAAQGFYAARGYGLRIGLAAGIMMVAVIGGRIVPSFTRNWLVQRGSEKLPAPPMQRFDRMALLVLLAALGFWVVLPEGRVTGGVLLVAGIVHLVRLGRWCGHLTLAEPLVAVLHVGYVFVPLGAVAIAAELALAETVGAAAAQHLWMSGAVGLMTLAVMTRATLGHTGRELHAGSGTVAIYAALILAVLARVAGGLWPDAASELHVLSGLAWLAAFAGFAALYGPLLLRARPANAR